MRAKIDLEQGSTKYGEKKIFIVLLSLHPFQSQQRSETYG